MNRIVVFLVCGLILMAPAHAFAKAKKFKGCTWSAGGPVETMTVKNVKGQKQWSTPSGLKFTFGQKKSKIGAADVNGDGLCDAVYAKSKSVFYLINPGQNPLNPLANVQRQNLKRKFKALKDTNKDGIAEFCYISKSRQFCVNTLNEVISTKRIKKKKPKKPASGNGGCSTFRGANDGKSVGFRYKHSEISGAGIAALTYEYGTGVFLNSNFQVFETTRYWGVANGNRHHYYTSRGKPGAGSLGEMASKARQGGNGQAYFKVGSTCYGPFDPGREQD